MSPCSRRGFIAAAASGLAWTSSAQGVADVPHFGSLLWSRRFGDWGAGDDPGASLTLAADSQHLFLALRDRVLAIDLRTGGPAWPAEGPADDGALFEIGQGPWGSGRPAATWGALSEGRLITLTGSIDQPAGEGENVALFPTLAAFDIAAGEGKLLWTQGVHGDLATSGWRAGGLPVVTGDTVWFTVVHRQHREQLALASIDVASGVSRGLVVLRNRAAAGVSWSSAAPVGAGDQVVARLSNGVLVAVSQKDRRVVWFSEQAGSESFPGVWNSGLLAGGGLVYDGSPGRHIRAFEVETGRPRWRFDLREPHPQVCGLPGGELICAGHRIWILDARTGSPRRRWGFEDLPVAGRVAVSGGGIIWSTGRELMMCDRSTGALLDRRRLDGPLAMTARDVWTFDSHIVTLGGGRVAVFEGLTP